MKHNQQRNRSQTRRNQYSSELSEYPDYGQNTYQRNDAQDMRNRWMPSQSSSNFNKPYYNQQAFDYDDNNNYESRNHDYEGGNYDMNQGRRGGEYYGSNQRSYMPYNQDSFSRTQNTSSRGEFYGKAPKNYERSDERIKEEICDRLMSQGMFDPSDVEIEVKDGVVSLQGNVDSRSTKYQLEEISEGILGVKDIDNKVKVSSSSKNTEDQKTSGTTNIGAYRSQSSGSRK